MKPMLSHKKLKVHGKGLERAERLAVKAAAYLDLCVGKAELDAEQRLAGMELSGRVVLMLRALSGSRPE
ncbi:MAG TPA: hypothetical protein VMS21_03930 [Methylomirabilota bacterium]|nr:hypothetical protein [Methylomirabilota bacterium]